MARRLDVMLCTVFEERRLTDPKFGWFFPVFGQPKLNGHRALARRNEAGEYMLTSSEGFDMDIPHITKELEAFGKQFPYEFDGELYVHGMCFEEISSLIKSRHKDKKALQFHIFDVYAPNTQHTFTTRFYNALFMEAGYGKMQNKPVNIVHTQSLYDLHQVTEFLGRCIDLNYEGMVIRHQDLRYESSTSRTRVAKRSTWMLKCKPKKFDVYRIQCVKEAISLDGTPKGMVGSFGVYTKDENEVFWVGAGTLTHEERKALWERGSELSGKYLYIAYQNMSTKGIPAPGYALRIYDTNVEEEQADAKI